MKRILILGVLAAMNSGVLAAPAGRIMGSQDSTEARIQDGTVISNRMAGVFQGYSAATKRVRISGVEYEYRPDLLNVFRRLRPNQTVVFEVSGEAETGYELIASIRDK